MHTRGKQRRGVDMKLFEHADFEQAISNAADHFRGRGLRPAIIEKDYYVTEALRIISLAAPDKIIFKGGTSLALAWKMFQQASILGISEECLKSVVHVLLYVAVKQR
jgi:hypothetical protein